MKFWIYILLTTLLMTTQGCSVFGIRSGYEQLDYTIEEQIGDVQIRTYPARIAVQIKGAKDDSEAFFALFDYISGKNISSTSISMTSPVELDRTSSKIAMTSPVEKSKDDDTATSMRFFIPKEFSFDEVPKPTDSRLTLVQLPSEKFAVLQYSGSSSDEKFLHKSAELIQKLKTTKWKVIDTPTFHGYDPPFTIPFLKRNEVVVKVIRQT